MVFHPSLVKGINFFLRISASFQSVSQGASRTSLNVLASIKFGLLMNVASAFMLYGQA